MKPSAPRMIWLARTGCAALGLAALSASASGPAAAQGAGSSCSAMVKGDEGYAFVPIANFDPSDESIPLRPPKPEDKVGAIICERKTIIPEPSDYRIMAEMHLPLAITAGDTTIWLGSNHGRLTVQVPAGEVSAEDQATLKASPPRGRPFGRSLTST